MTVRSLALAPADPPPATVAWLVTRDGGFAATSTVVAIGGQLLPGANESLRVQYGRVEQSQPVPLIDTRVKPGGNCSVTVTVPLVAPEETLLLTSMV
jgi:hypothetical protein